MEESRKELSEENSALHNVPFIMFSDPRNDVDYDTFEYGTEPIPNDTTWIKPTTPAHLYAHVLNRFKQEQTVDMQRLAALAVTELLTLPSETLLRLSKAVPPLVQ